ncbi:MAG: hypothetical protein FWC09_07590 [Lachnospiraceae bacterium]|nr:hypothetical protein [Lachnospiraceae bacterium]
MKMNETAKVIKILNNYEVVINKGYETGIQTGHEFLVYLLGEELIDLDTNESLGHLEILCGKAEIKHIQPKMTTLISNNHMIKVRKRIIKNSGGSSFAMISGLTNQTTEETEPEEERVPFKNVAIGCYARRIY